MSLLVFLSHVNVPPIKNRIRKLNSKIKAVPQVLEIIWNVRCVHPTAREPSPHGADPSRERPPPSPGGLSPSLFLRKPLFLALKAISSSSLAPGCDVRTEVYILPHLFYSLKR